MNYGKHYRNAIIRWLLVKTGIWFEFFKVERIVKRKKVRKYLRNV